MEGFSVLVFDGIIYSLQSHGGISVYFNEILRRVSSFDMPSKVLMYGDNQVSQANRFSMQRLEPDKRFGERYRDVELSSVCSLFHSSYYRLPENNKTPAIVSVYDFTYEHFRRGPRRWLHSWQKFRAIRNSAAAICISESTRRDLLHYLPSFPSERVFVIPLSANEEFRPMPMAELPQGQPYVLFVGARSGYKNFSAVVHALSRIKDVALYVVGGGAFLPEEIKLMEALLPHRYRHCGAVDSQGLNKLYNQAVCLIYPSSYEGFGIPVLEAMRAGCPVIAVAASSIPEVAGEAAVLLPSAQPELISEAILGLGDEKRRLAARNAGLKQAAKFSWDRTFMETVQIYENVLGKDIFPKTI